MSLLTCREVCHYLRISKRTLWRWVKEKRLPAPVYLADRCPRWDMEEVAAFLKQNRTALRKTSGSKKSR